MRQSSILLINFILSFVFSSSYANLIPEEWDDKEGIWQFGLEAAYLKQTNNLPELNTVEIVPLAPITVFDGPNDLFTPILQAEEEAEWGYKFNIAYIFPKHLYDVRGSYTWLHDKIKKDNRGQETLDVVGNPAHPIRNGIYDYNFEEVDISIGRLYEPTDNLLLRLGLGIVYAKILQEGDGTVNTFDVDDFFGCFDGLCANTFAEFRNEYEGTGIKLLLDSYFDLHRYFSLVGGIGISVLYGNSTAELEGISNAEPFYCYGPDPFDCVDETYNLERERNFALGLDAQAAIRYSQLLSENTAININVGYQATTYINALQEGSTQLDLTNTQDEIVTYEFDKRYYNYGPYVSLSIDFK